MAHVIFYDDVVNTNNRRWDWYNREHYVGQYYMAYHGYGDPIGLPRDEFTACRLWMINNLDAEILIYEESHSLGRSFHFYFSYEEDMTKFKLSKWGQYIQEK